MRAPRRNEGIHTWGGEAQPYSSLEAAAVVWHDETVFAIDPEREVIFPINY